MMSLRTYFKQNRGILILLILLIILRILYLFRFNIEGVWWDSSVYIHMGKYIFSLGKFGLFEEIRPIIWPLILGFFWKIKLDVVFFGRVLEFLSFLGVVYLTYLIGLRYDKKTALLSSIIVGFGYTMFLYSFRLYTGIPSLFFCLFGLYLFLENRFVWAGLLMSIGFLTRFPQGLVFGVMFFYLVFNNRKLKNIIRLGAGFGIPVLIYLIFNHIMYKNPFWPFILAQETIKISGAWIYTKPFYYYIFEMIKSNFLLIFSFIGLGSLFNKKFKDKFLIYLFFVILIYFSFLSHKEPRYILVLIPYAALLSSIFMFRVFSKKIVYILTGVFLVFSIVSGFMVYSEMVTSLYNDEVLENFYGFLDEEVGLVLSSNPRVGIYNDHKLVGLYYYPYTYYPYFDKKMVDLLINKDYNYAFINSCDLICPDDNVCINNKNMLLDLLDKRFIEKIYDNKIGDCEYSIFKG